MQKMWQGLSCAEDRDVCSDFHGQLVWGMYRYKAGTRIVREILRSLAQSDQSYVSPNTSPTSLLVIFLMSLQRIENTVMVTDVSYPVSLIA